MSSNKITMASTLTMLLCSTAIADTSYMQADNDGTLQNQWIKTGINKESGTFGSGDSQTPGILFDPTGTGSFDIIRNTRNYAGNDFFSYWSSPIQQVDATPSTIFLDAELIYKYDSRTSDAN